MAWEDSRQLCAAYRNTLPGSHLGDSQLTAPPSNQTDLPGCCRASILSTLGGGSLLVPFYRWGDRGPNALSVLTKVTHLRSVAGDQDTGVPSPHAPAAFVEWAFLLALVLVQSNCPAKSTMKNSWAQTEVPFSAILAATEKSQVQLAYGSLDFCQAKPGREKFVRQRPDNWQILPASCSNVASRDSPARQGAFLLQADA